jgi:hypothetical protein
MTWQLSDASSTADDACCNLGADKHGSQCLVAITFLLSCRNGVLHLRRKERCDPGYVQAKHSLLQDKLLSLPMPGCLV